MLVDLEKGLKKRGAQSGEVRVHGKQLVSNKQIDFEGSKGNEIGLEERESTEEQALRKEVKIGFFFSPPLSTFLD